MSITHTQRTAIKRALTGLSLLLWMVLAAQGASASIASFHTGGLNARVTVDHLIERAGAATSPNPVVNQQGLIGLGHFIESRYGVKLGDILFYNGKQTTNASLGQK